jgi:hypothetical protein
MDYCSSCRRHLNGALVCPGCGAYAPDIAPVTVPGRTSAAPAATALWPESAAIPDTDAYAYGGLDDFQDADADVEAPASTTQAPGRAARRRQRARWKKNQRKAVVATAVALVGGGLTVASMDRGSGHSNQASTATDLTSMGSGEQSVDTSADLPSTTPGTGKHRKPRADEASGTSHRGSTTATAAHTDSAKTQRYTVPTPASTPTAAEQVTKAVEDTTSTATDTATKATQSPSSTSDNSTGSGSSGTSNTSGTSTSSGSSSSSTSTSGTSQSSSDSASTSPSGICVLGLLCVS